MKEIQTNLNQICANCKYFCDNSPIICAVHPDDALTEMDSCSDFTIGEKPRYQCQIFEVENGYRILASALFVKLTYYYWDLIIYPNHNLAETKGKSYIEKLILNDYPGPSLSVQEIYKNWGIITQSDDNIIKWINPHNNQIHTQTEFDIPTYYPLEDIIQEIKEIIDEEELS